MSDELHKEIERLRHKLSPLEDKEFTKKLAARLGSKDLMQFKRKFRKADYIVVSPKDIADVAGLSHDLHVLTNIGRSLQALCWERSALHGQLIFVMPIEEYQSGLQ